MAYSIQSTVREILASEEARAVIDKYLPGATSHPQIALAANMSLASIAQMAGKRFPQEALGQIDAELRKL